MITAERWTTLTRERLLWLYDRMTLIREFEERLKLKATDRNGHAGRVGPLLRR
jgi:TPP-dependent pyruvate/acetoin dehydrogenase alpha subunit